MAVIIKTFSTPGGKYVYDRETNSLLSVSEDEFTACQRVEANTADDHDWQLLKRYIEQGYLKETRLKEIEHPATPILEYLLENQMKQLTMQVTQNCNLRCSYCAYGGSYNHQRGHTNATMPLETMKKCADFIMHRSNGVDLISIGFYGGEPLLELDNIRACIKYINETYPGRRIDYTITTNGTYLDEDVVSFLKDNDIKLAISFDGPREMHDKNRVYCDGRGSFDDILKSLERIKFEHPNYFSKISFITTVAPTTDFSCVNNFFNAEEIIKENQISQGTVNIYSSKNDVKFGDAYSITYRYQRMKVLLSEIGLYNSQKVSRLFSPVMSGIGRFYAGLSSSAIPRKAHPGGPCVPGITRPFIDVTGKLFPCERLNEKSEVMQVGHLDTGFDISRLNAILNVGKLTESECIKCWCFSHCTLCAIASDGDTHLSRIERLKHCNASKYNTAETIKSICLLSENNYDFETQALMREGVINYYG